MFNKTVLIFTFLLPVIITGAYIPAHAEQPRIEIAIKRQYFRNDYVKFETIIDALDITSGMTIVDIGSGPGYASFLLAEKLNGTGAVFATDIREDFIKYIAEEAERRKLTNLFSVLVQEDGVDDFYGKHRYDLVFLSNVYHALDNRIHYFKELRKFLNPGARLVLLLYNPVPLFAEDDLSDLDEIINILTRDTKDDPFRENLSIATKQLLAENLRTRDIRKALVEDFNTMLTDPHFYENFFEGPYLGKDIFNRSERELANWLLMTLKEDGVLEKPFDQIDAKSMRTVIKLNRLFFKSTFGDYLANGGFGAYIPVGDPNRHTSKYVVFRELGEAGYRFAEEIELSPFYTAVIMVPVQP